MGSFLLNTNVTDLKIRVNYNITQNEEQNQSTVKVDLYITHTGVTQSWNGTGQAYYNIGINNQRKGDTYFKFDLRGKPAWAQDYIGSHTLTVTHDNNGEANIPIWVYVRTGISAGTINQTRRITLPRIIRNANITSVSNTDLSDPSISYSVNNLVSGNTYKVEGFIDGISYWYQTFSDTGSQNRALDLSSYIRNQILDRTPYTKTVPIRLALTTLDDSGRELGTSANTGTLTIDSSYAPTTGSSVLSRINEKNDNLYENISSIRFTLGRNTSGTAIPPSAARGASISKIQIINELDGRVLYNASSSAIRQIVSGTPITVNLNALSTGNYKFSMQVTDSRGLTSSTSWATTYTFKSYALPKIKSISTERDGNRIKLEASIEPGTDPMKYQVILNGNGYVHDSQIVVPLDKYNDGYVKDSFNGYFNSSGTYTSVKEDDSFEVELRIYYGTSDYVSARGSVGTADIPLSLGKFGAGVGTLVDDNGAHLQVGEKGLTSGGGGTFYGMVDIDLDHQTKMELKGTSSNGSLMRFIIDGKHSGWIGSWGNDLQVTSPTNDRLVLSSDQITYGGNPLGYSSGNNINGDWIKFNDGTAICYGRVTTTYNQPWVTMADWYYPIKFNKRPIVIATVSQGSGSGLIATIDDSRTNNLFADVKVTQKEDSVNFTSTKTHDAQVIAIGRWK